MENLEFYDHQYFTYREDSHDLVLQALASYINNIKQNSPLNIPYAKTSTNQLEPKSRIYTGYGGKLFTFWKLFTWDSTYYSDFYLISQTIKSQISNLESNGPTFFQGKVGILAILAVSDQDSNLVSEILNSIPTHYKKFELLYGAAGALYVLGFILKYWEAVPQKVEIIKKIRKIARNIVKKSENKNILIHKYPSRSGDKYYLGAAHGTIGILHIMLQLLDHIPEYTVKIKSSLNFLISQQLPSGNFPSKLNSLKDESIHFCHGSVGSVPLFCLAYERFQESVFLESAIKAADDIWKRGALRKGRGLCHGIAGNGYSFLALYKTTKDEVWLQRAFKFAVVLGFDEEYEKSVKSYEDPQRMALGVPDFPFSLMEGACGTVCFLADCTQPLEAKFPGFDI